MRDINFRVWDNLEKAYLNEKDITIDSLGNIFIIEGYDHNDSELWYARILPDPDNKRHIICSYAQDMWSGEGAAVLKDRNGKFMFIELGHCSCYGPLEERNPKCIYSLEEIIKLLDKHCKDTYGGYAKAVAEKLKEVEDLANESTIPRKKTQ